MEICIFNVLQIFKFACTTPRLFTNNSQASAYTCNTLSEWQIGDILALLRQHPAFPLTASEKLRLHFHIKSKYQDQSIAQILRAAVELKDPNHLQTMVRTTLSGQRMPFNNMAPKFVNTVEIYLGGQDGPSKKLYNSFPHITLVSASKVAANILSTRFEDGTLPVGLIIPAEKLAEMGICRLLFWIKEKNPPFSVNYRGTPQVPFNPDDQFAVTVGLYQTVLTMKLKTPFSHSHLRDTLIEQITTMPLEPEDVILVWNCLRDDRALVRICLHRLVDYTDDGIVDGQNLTWETAYRNIDEHQDLRDAIQEIRTKKAERIQREADLTQEPDRKKRTHRRRKRNNRDKATQG